MQCQGQMSNVDKGRSSCQFVTGYNKMNKYTTNQSNGVRAISLMKSRKQLAGAIGRLYLMDAYFYDYQNFFSSES